MLHSIMDIQQSSISLKDEDGFVKDKNKNNQTRMKKTTAEFELKVALLCGDNIYKQWIPLKKLKELNPINVAQFFEARGLYCKPAF